LEATIIKPASVFIGAETGKKVTKIYSVNFVTLLQAITLIKQIDE
jgi:hypothetical protein